MQETSALVSPRQIWLRCSPSPSLWSRRPRTSPSSSGLFWGTQKLVLVYVQGQGWRSLIKKHAFVSLVMSSFKKSFWWWMLQCSVGLRRWHHDLGSQFLLINLTKKNCATLKNSQETHWRKTCVVCCSEPVNITESSLLVTNHSPSPSSLQGSSSDSQNHIQDNPAGQPGERLLRVCQLLAPSSGGEEKEEEEAFIYSTLGNFVKLQQHIQCKGKN